MNQLYFGAFVIAATVAVNGQQPPAGTPVPGNDKVAPGPITLTGCVAAGTEKGTFMLTNVHRTDPAAATTGGVANANPKPTTAHPDANVVYWLDSGEKLEGHVGHSVQIEGTLDDDVDKSKVKTEDGKTSVTTERTKSVGVPQGGTAGTRAAAGGEAKRLTYKVKVKSLKMLSGTCAK